MGQRLTAAHSAALCEPSVPRRLLRLPDTPLVHLGTGLLIVTLYALSAIPAITAERGRVPACISLAAASADSQVLRIVFILADAKGRSIAASGTAEVTVLIPQPGALMGEPVLVPVGSFRVRTPRSRFVPGFNPREARRDMVCRLKGIPLRAVPALAYAAQAQTVPVLRVAYVTDTGHTLAPVQIGVALEPGSAYFQGAVR